MNENDINIILKALEEYKNKLNEENLKLNNISLFAKNLDIIGDIIKLKNILNNEKLFVYTINGREVTKEELIKYLFENTGDHIPRID